MSGFDQSPWERRLSPRNTLDGDGLFSLEGVNTNALTDGCLCWVRDVQADYVFLRGSTQAPSLPDVVQPAAGPGRWVRYAGIGGTGIAALVPIATGLTGISDFVTTEAAGAVEMGPGLSQTFAALAGDVFLADIQASAVGTSGTPASDVRFSAKMDGAEQVPGNGIDANVGPPDDENAGVNGLLVAPAAGNVEIQAFVEVVSPPATPTAEVTVEGVNLRVVQLRPVTLGTSGGGAPLNTERRDLGADAPLVIGAAAIQLAALDFPAGSSPSTWLVMLNMTQSSDADVARVRYSVRVDGAQQSPEDAFDSNIPVLNAAGNVWGGQSYFRTILSVPAGGLTVEIWASAAGVNPGTVTVGMQSQVQAIRLR